MEEITALRQHIFNYSKTRDVFRAYCQCKPKEKAKFAAAHQTELDRHQAAKAAFNALSEQKLPTVKELSAEFEKLKQQKGKLYAEYRAAKEERAKLLTVKANLELILDRNPHEIEQEAQQHGR